MNYLLVKNSDVAVYPYSIAAFRRDNPNVSTPINPTEETLSEFGVFLVQETARPEATSLQNVIELAPVLIDGVWTQQWTVANATPEQVVDRKNEAWEQIKRERDRRKAGGVKVGEHWFHSDPGSRIQQIGLVMMGAGIPANLHWKTMSGALVTMTPTLAGQIFAATSAHDQAAFAVAEQHRIAMEASTDPDAYDYSAGWPAAYGEQL